MTVHAVVPVFVMVMLASAAGLIRWPIRPMTAVRVLSVTAAVSAGTVLLMAIVGVVAVLGRAAMVLSMMRWCPLVPFHHDINAMEGAVSLLVVAASGWRMRRVFVRRRWAMHGTNGRRLAVLDTDEPIAYAAPGTPGCVVVSQGMLNALSPKERKVLFAHERAHLDQHHHRYLLAVELAVAVLPTLRLLADQVRLASERAADESAAHVMGDDRRLVARSIARAAVTASEYRNLVGGFGGGSVPHRIHALLDPPPRQVVLRAGAAVVLVVSIAVVGAGGIQIHHVAELVGQICPT